MTKKDKHFKRKYFKDIILKLIISLLVKLMSLNHDFADAPVINSFANLF